MKNTPKVAVAFMATCAENFSSGTSTYKNSNVHKPGKDFCITSSQDKVKLIKTKNLIQLFGKIFNTISVLLSMHQMEDSHVHTTEFILFMQLHRYFNATMEE